MSASANVAVCFFSACQIALDFVFMCVNIYNVTSLSTRHARKHFSQAEGGQLDEVRQVMGMLAFPSDTHISPYKVRGLSETGYYCVAKSLFCL